MAIKQRNTEHPAKVLEEHASLWEILDEARAALAERRARPQSIAEMLDELAQHVLDHFRHEETGGYFAEAIDVAPRLSERADDLLRQHPRLAAQLAQLRQYARRNDPSEAWWLRLSEMFTQFVSRFSEHECAENELLQDAYSTDIGAED